MKVLIVEDDIVSGKLLKKMLSAYGEVEIATTGKKGVELFEKNFEEGEPFDLICLDIMMPNMTGHEVLKSVRKIEEENNVVYGVKIIMTTALGDFDNIKIAYREQCEDYLVKPILKANMEKSLKKLGLI